MTTTVLVKIRQMLQTSNIYKTDENLSYIIFGKVRERIQTLDLNSCKIKRSYLQEVIKE